MNSPHATCALLQFKEGLRTIKTHIDSRPKIKVIASNKQKKNGKK